MTSVGAVTDDTKAANLRVRGWTESCVCDGYWNPPTSLREAMRKTFGEERVVLTLDEAYRLGVTQ